MDKRPQRLAKNKTDLMPNNASCKRWDTPEYSDVLGSLASTGSRSRRTKNNALVVTVRLRKKTKVFIHTYGGRKPLILSTFIVVFCP